MSPRPTLSPTPTESPKYTPLPDLRWRAATSAPSTLIVYREGRIEVLRRDGRLIRTLADRSETGELSFSFSLSPERRTLYFVRYGTGSCSDIVSVPVAGGALRTIARGNSVSLSPDGTRLLYADSWNCGSRGSRAVLRDLASGTERVINDRSELGGGGVAWMPDGRYFSFDQSGADSCGPRLVDSRTMRFVDRTAYTLPAYTDAFACGHLLRGDTGKVVLHIMYSSTDGTEPSPILEYDTKTRVTRALFERSRGAGVLDFDAHGYHMLYKTRDHRLYWYDGRRAKLIAAGIRYAVW